jgi:hypothetical protein
MVRARDLGSGCRGSIQEYKGDDEGKMLRRDCISMMIASLS